MECPDCHSGKLWCNEGNGDCSSCYGTGEEQNFLVRMTDGMLDLDPSDCFICSGTGQCQTCGGTGIVDEDDEDESLISSEDDNCDEENSNSDSDDNYPSTSYSTEAFDPRPLLKSEQVQPPKKAILLPTKRELVIGFLESKSTYELERLLVELNLSIASPLLPVPANIDRVELKSLIPKYLAIDDASLCRLGILQDSKEFGDLACSKLKSLCKGNPKLKGTIELILQKKIQLEILLSRKESDPQLQNYFQEKEEVARQEQEKKLKVQKEQEKHKLKMQRELFLVQLLVILGFLSFCGLFYLAKLVLQW